MDFSGISEFLKTRGVASLGRSSAFRDTEKVIYFFFILLVYRKNT